MMKITTSVPICTRAPSHWIWHKQRLLYLLSRLLEERDTQMAEVSATTQQNSMDTTDIATDEFDNDMAFSFLSNEQNALDEVTAALHRIQEGRYGICEETGRPIPAQRLRAVPWTRYTREVQECLERDGAERHRGEIIRHKSGANTKGDRAALAAAIPSCLSR